MAGRLYTYPNNFRAQKIQIAAQYSKKEIELVDYVAGETNKSDDFLAKFPLGKVPAYEDNELRLFETNAIAYYVGNEVTRGGGNEAEVLQWIGVADNEILPAACTWVYPTLGIMQYNKQGTEKAKEDIKAVLNAMNSHLLTRTFLVGERVSQADISVACTLLMLYTNVMDPSFRESYGNVNRWFITAINQPEFKAVLGEINLCTKMAQFDAKKYNEVCGKSASKKKATTPKKPEKQKKTTKAAGDNAPESDTKANQEPTAPVKKVDPWANSPEPSMDMDAWKRSYSNNEPDVYWKYFLEHFPTQDYSVWHCTYNYNDNLRMGFMASNLVSGMLQRLEKLRKNCFSSVLVFSGGSHAYEIEGIWIWLGQELAFTLSPDWQIDYESYNWKKLDFSDESVQHLVKAFWSWEGDFGGKTVYDGKTYK